MRRKILILVSMALAMSGLFLAQVMGNDYSAIRSPKITTSETVRAEAGKELGALLQSRVTAVEGQQKNIVAKVNGAPIYELDLLTATDFYQAKGIAVDKNKIMRQLIRTTALVGEAQKRGVAATFQEAVEYSIKEVQEGIERNDTLLLAILEGAGMTPEEYAEKVQATPNQRLLSIKALNEVLIKEGIAAGELSDVKELTPEETARRQEYLTSIHDEIVAKATVEILEEKFRDWFDLNN